MPKSSNYKKLSGKWVQRHRELSQNLWEKHGNSLKNLAVGSAAAALLLTSPVKFNLPIQVSASQNIVQPGQDNLLVADLSKSLPKEMGDLTPKEETQLAQEISAAFGIDARVGINGIRLDRSYGLIGQEQHLARYPGDSVTNHELPSYGMAPGLGAWRYFTNSNGEMTQEDVLREKYYIAVPTFLAPGFDRHVAEFRDFFKYRKMIVVNPQNGRAIIADIADSGPAVWTGKNLGGSPEVMTYLERVDRTPVLYFFVDDPNDKIPLGPINLVKQ